jgi:hypothetical protein
MGDKYSGAVVGEHTGGGVEFEEAAASTGVEELLVAPGGGPAPALLSAALDTGTGAVVWQPVPDVAAAQAAAAAKSQMTSMLRDSFRNDEYRKAVRAAVRALTQAAAASSPPAPLTVLDIGAGTGLLSLLAAEAGAAEVVGIEQWPTMASVAASVASAAPEPVRSRVRIICGHSSEVGVGLGGGGADGLSRKADLVVSEIVDSALLGEGVIPALRDAYARLVDPSRAAAAGVPPTVPVRATVRGRLVWADEATLWQNTCGAHAVLRPCGLEGSGTPALSLARTEWAATCAATAPASIPVHAARLPSLVPVSEDFVAAELDFTPAGVAATDGPLDVVVRVPALAAPAAGAAGRTANAVLWWWDLVLWEGRGADPGPPLVYSTNPAAAQPWQDHWVQVLFPLSVPASPSGASGGNSGGGGGGFTVACTRNDMAFSFVAGPAECEVWPSKRARSLALKGKSPAQKGAAAAGAAAPATPSPTAATALFTEPEPCSCGLHSLYTHERRWMLGDAARTSAFRSAVDAAVRSAAEARVAELRAFAAEAWIDDDEDGGVRDVKVRVLDISDGSVCGLLAATATGLPDGCSVLAFSLERGDAAVVHAQAVATQAGIVDRFAVLAGYECHEVTPEVVGVAEAELTGAAGVAGGMGAESEEGGGIVGDGGLEVGAGEADDDNGGGGGGAAADAGMATDEGETLTVDNDEDEEGGDGMLLYTGPTQTLDLLVAEPWFAQMASAHSLWAAACFWYRRTALGPALSVGARVLPLGAAVRAQAVCFADLHRNHGPVGSVQGFDHGAFDALVRGWESGPGATLSLPVWQYAFTPCGDPVTLASLDFSGPAPRPGEEWAPPARAGDSAAAMDAAAGGVVPKPAPAGRGTYRVGGEALLGGAAQEHSPNAVLFWVDYALDATTTVSTGPRPGNAPSYYRQAVRFLPPQQQQQHQDQGASVRCAAWLDEERGTLEMYTGWAT